MRFFSKPPFVEPEMTQADYLAEAHAAMKRAEAACKSAKDELFRYECRSKTYGLKTLPETVTAVGRHKNGQPVRFQISTKPVTDDKGMVAGVEGSMRAA